MKILTAAAICLTLLFAACGNPAGNNSGGNIVCAFAQYYDELR